MKPCNAILFSKEQGFKEGLFGMSNQSDVSSAGGEVCGLGGSNTGDFCDLRDEVKEGRGELQETFFYPQVVFMFPMKVA